MSLMHSKIQGTTSQVGFQAIFDKLLFWGEGGGWGDRGPKRLRLHKPCPAEPKFI